MTTNLNLKEHCASNVRAISELKYRVVCYFAATVYDCIVYSIHIVCSKPGPLSDCLVKFLNHAPKSNAKYGRHIELAFDKKKEDSLNNIFKEIKNPIANVVFSIDDDIIFLCSTVELAYTVWRSAPDTMVGFVPRIHLINPSNSHASTFALEFLKALINKCTWFTFILSLVTINGESDVQVYAKESNTLMMEAVKKGSSLKGDQESIRESKPRPVDESACILFLINRQLFEVDLLDFIVGRPEAEALEVMTLFSELLKRSDLGYLNH
nr:glycosyltransferase family 64 protein C4 [Tanacetum cinerariifolium]